MTDSNPPDENPYQSPGSLEHGSPPEVEPRQQTPVPSLVTVATFTKSAEAHLRRLALQQAGIKAFLQDEHFSDVNFWGMANAIGGVKLQVDPADVELALRVLNEAEGRPADYDRFGPEESVARRFAKVLILFLAFAALIGLLSLLTT